MNTVKRSSLLNELLTHKQVHQNLSTPVLVEKILHLNEADLSATGAICAETGKYTGRSPKDRFIVRDDVSDLLVDWGPVNKPVDERSFDQLHNKVVNYLQDKNELFSFKGFAGADKTHQLPIQVITEYAWHNLFSKQMFIEPTVMELKELQPEFTILSAPTFKADPAVDGTNSEAFVIISFKKKIILIIGTDYVSMFKLTIIYCLYF